MQIKIRSSQVARFPSAASDTLSARSGDYNAGQLGSTSERFEVDAALEAAADHSVRKPTLTATSEPDDLGDLVRAIRLRLVEFAAGFSREEKHATGSRREFCVCVDAALIPDIWERCWWSYACAGFTPGRPVDSPSSGATADRLKSGAISQVLKRVRRKQKSPASAGDAGGYWLRVDGAGAAHHRRGGPTTVTCAEATLFESVCSRVDVPTTARLTKLTP